MNRVIRTTMRPHEKIEVSPAEYLDLSRQGFILREEEVPEPGHRPGMERAMVETNVPTESTTPEVTPERKTRNRRADIPGESESPRNAKES